MTKNKTKVLPYNFTEEEKAQMPHGDKCECHECWLKKGAAARKRKVLAQRMKDPATRKKVVSTKHPKKAR